MIIPASRLKLGHSMESNKQGQIVFSLELFPKKQSVVQVVLNRRRPDIVQQIQCRQTGFFIELFFLVVHSSL